MPKSKRAILVGSVIVGLAGGLAVAAQAQIAPRFEPGYASLMTDRVEVRRQPGYDQPVAVVFRRAGMPVCVAEQAKGWRRIQDRDGATGWVPESLLSLRRTAIVVALPGAGALAPVTLRGSDRSGGDPVALLEPGVVVGLVTCDGRVCRISTSGVRGYVDQKHLWGVGEGETVR